MADPLARERAREVVHAGFGDGVGGVRLRGVYDVGGHGGCEEDGGGREGEGDYLSEEVSGVGGGGGASGPGDRAGDEEAAVEVDVEDAAPGVEGVVEGWLGVGDAGEAEEGVDAVELGGDVRDGVIDGCFGGDVDAFE